MEKARQEMKTEYLAMELEVSPSRMYLDTYILDLEPIAWLYGKINWFYTTRQQTILLNWSLYYDKGYPCSVMAKKTTKKINSVGNIQLWKKYILGNLEEELKCIM